MKKRLPVILLIVAVSLGVWYFLLRKPPPDPSRIEGSGTIEATQVDLAPKVAGRVTVIHVKEGDAVKRGDVLAELDADTLQDQVSQAEAAVKEAEGRVAEARASLNLEREQYQATVSQARAAEDASRTHVPQASESEKMQEATVGAQVNQARAQLASAQAAYTAAASSLGSARANVGTSQANLDMAQANLDKAEADNRRNEQLFKQDAISAQQLDQTRTAVSTTRAQRNAARASRDAARDQVGVARSQLDAAQHAVQQWQANLDMAEANRRSVPIKRLDVESSQAQLQQAAAGVQVAEAGAGRIRQREEQGAQAEAALNQARAALRVARTNRSNAILQAPFDATVLSKNVEVGDLVNVGSPVVTIADLQRPYLRVYVSEADFARVRLKAPAEVRVDGSSRVFTGSVDEMKQRSEYIPENVQTKEQRAKQVFGVRIRLENPDGELKPGLPADAVIHAIPGARPSR